MSSCDVIRWDAQQVTLGGVTPSGPGTRETVTSFSAGPALLALLGACVVATVVGSGGTLTTRTLADQPAPSTRYVVDDRRRRNRRQDEHPNVVNVGGYSTDLAGVQDSRTTIAVGITDRLALAQNQLGLTTTHLAEVLRVTRATVYSWLRGQATPRSRATERINHLARVADEWSAFNLGALKGPAGAAAAIGERSLLDLLREDEWNEREITRALKRIRDISIVSTTRKANRQYRSIADVLKEHGKPTLSATDRAHRATELRTFGPSRG